jgi:hypothetical protein
MHPIDSVSAPRIYSIAADICLGVAVLSCFMVVILIGITRIAVWSGAMTRLLLRRRWKSILAFSASAGLSGASSIALVVDIHSFRSFLVGELSIGAGIMALTLVVGAITSSFALASSDCAADEEDGYWRCSDSFDIDAGAPTINPASGLPMCGSLDVAGNPYGCDSDAMI